MTSTGTSRLVRSLQSGRPDLWRGVRGLSSCCELGGTRPLGTAALPGACLAILAWRIEAARDSGAPGAQEQCFDTDAPERLL